MSGITATAALLDAKLLLLQKEQEVAGLREVALKQLESQLADKQQQFERLTSQFEQLKQDFKYNLSLLEDRDAELEKYDGEMAVLAAAMNDKDLVLAELQKRHADALFELKAERAKGSESEFLQQSKRAELQKQLEDERIMHAEAAIRQREECEQAKRALQRALSEVQEELQQQRREMTASFDVQLQQLEAKYRQQAEDAAQEAASATQLARRREEEARTARQREEEQIAATGAALARERDKDKAVKALTWELEQMKRLADQQQADLTDQLQSLQQISKSTVEQAEVQVASLATQLAKAQHQLAELSSQSASSLARQQMQAREETALLKVKLEQAQGRNSELEVEARDLQGHLRTLRTEMQDKVERLEQELRLVKETADMALSDYERRREADVAELNEQLWAQQQAGKASRDKMDGLRKLLEEKNADITGLKERLTAAGARERALQRKLVEVELKLEQQVEARQAAMEAEESTHVRQLTDQRDAAISSLQDAQSRLLDKEAELGQLRDLLIQMSPRRGTSAAAAHRAAASQRAAAAEPPASPTVDAGPRQYQQQQQQAGMQRDSFRQRARQLSVDLPNRTPQDSLDFMAEQFQMPALPSPSMMLLDSTPSPRPPGSSMWGAGLANTAAAAAAAARAEQFLRESKQGVDELLRPRPSRLAEMLLDSPAMPSSPGDAPGRLDALAAAEDQNQRLRSTLAAMRAEMVALQAAVAAPMSMAPGMPQDVAVLQAELEESDRDLQQALEHVEVLQRQLSQQLQQQQAAADNPHGAADAGSDDNGAPLELPFLRQRVQQLTAENRAVRRQAVQLRMAAAKQQAVEYGAAGDGNGTPVAGDGRWPPQGTSPGVGLAEGVPAGLVGVVAASTAARVAELQRQLADTTAHLQQLQGENDSLMELSNALRAERERLLAVVAAWGVSSEEGQAGGVAMLLPPLLAPRGYSPAPAQPPVAQLPGGSPGPLMSSQQQALATSAGLSGAGAPGSGAPPTASAQERVPDAVQSRLPTADAVAEGGRSGPPHAGPQQDAGPGDRPTAAPPARRQVHFFADASMQRSQSDSGTGSPRAASGVGVDAPRNLMPADRHAQGEALDDYIPMGGQGGVQGRALPTVIRPPSAVPGSASSRETTSQRARLQALQHKPKVRNYNIKHDQT